MLPPPAAALGAVAVAGPVPVLVGAGVAVQSSFNPQRAYRALLKLDSKNARKYGIRSGVLELGIPTSIRVSMHLNLVAHPLPPKAK